MNEIYLSSQYHLGQTFTFTNSSKSDSILIKALHMDDVKLLPLETKTFILKKKPWWIFWRKSNLQWILQTD